MFLSHTLCVQRFLSFFFFFLMIRRPPRSTQGVSSAASDVYKRQLLLRVILEERKLQLEYYRYKILQHWRSRGQCVALRKQEISPQSLEDFPSDVEVGLRPMYSALIPVSYTHLRAHETSLHLVCRLLLEKKKKTKNQQKPPVTLNPKRNTTYTNSGQ
eukprot:TRINITY_DN12219_c0_g1_i1.p1 TRINITY_DN12219_c0_g1~~TRINITY_DN12219_c0_g1_i1.p1  ORF type:complete len:158 (-),score=31.90 TRINITY_DN12219_c0_g1_i1:43-516(-)